MLVFLAMLAAINPAAQGARPDPAEGSERPSPLLAAGAPSPTVAPSYDAMCPRGFVRQPLLGAELLCCDLNEPQSAISLVAERLSHCSDAVSLTAILPSSALVLKRQRQRTQNVQRNV